MTIREVHDLMENELRCVQRASVNGCDRECDTCPLVRDTDDIVAAYGYVIKMLENNTEYIIEEQKYSIGKWIEQHMEELK